VHRAAEGDVIPALNGEVLAIGAEKKRILVRMAVAERAVGAALEQELQVTGGVVHVALDRHPADIVEMPATGRSSGEAAAIGRRSCA
jgi:hypothetical protein